jgi:predicted transcriptional regulator
MGTDPADGWTRRERQIMEVVYRAGVASAREVRAGMPEAPSYSAVRAMLAVLVGKGVLRRRRDGRRLIYSPVLARPKAKRQAVRSLLRTFFEGSPEKLVASLLDPAEQALSAGEIERIRRLVDGRAAAGGGGDRKAESEVRR